MTTQDGGYDDGYRACPCFWGKDIGSMIKHYLLERDVAKMTILDAGCGEGKNAVALAKLGANVTAIDCSAVALENARNTFNCDSVDWQLGDIREFDSKGRKFDLVIAYGLMHCLQSKSEIFAIVRHLQEMTKPGGWSMLCAFNDREHDLTAHPGFKPCLIPHEDYGHLYLEWEIELFTDEDLHETHPHNNIPHVHSMTRLIARKVSK
jgi:cyclopropane fatty-acyl-phospholipid synthase-like methyltransferase